MKRLLNDLFLQWTEGRRSPGLLFFGAVARPMSWLYRLGAACDRRLRYPPPLSLTGRTRLAVIASPLVGGVGKTPLAAMIANGLAARGLRTELVTTGYGRQTRGAVTLGPSGSPASPDQAGDEALVLSQMTRLPVHVDDDPATVVARLDQDADLVWIVLDDGVRRRWKGEDRIVAFTDRDLERPLRFLPDGRWRVPPDYLWPATGVAIAERSGSGVRDARRSRHRETLRRMGYDGPIGWYRTRAESLVRCDDPAQEPQSPPDSAPLVFSGLGMPDRFTAQVQALGLSPRAVLRFPDHHRYTPADGARLESDCRRNDAQWLLTTHKDAVKIDPRWCPAFPVYYLRIALELTDGDDMLSVILESRR